MKRVCIVGAAAALAREVMQHYLDLGWEVTGVWHRHRCELEHPRLRLIPYLDRKVLRGEIHDLLLTFTGRTQDARLELMTDLDWEEVVGGTLTPVFGALRAVIPLLKDGSNIVVVGSIVGSVGGFGCANYAAAKAGLVGLVRAAANELASRNIRANLLELGYVNAGMGSRLKDEVKEAILRTIPLRRFAEVNEVVEAIDYLGSVKYMTGNVLTLAGGLR